MDLTPIIPLLRERIGLDPESLGPSALSRAVEARRQALHPCDPEDYGRRLSEDPNEFQSLIDELAVAETWFFRGDELFAYLAGQIREQCQARSSHPRYRVLSIPCSTGEEPFSLAISLIDAKVPTSAWSIDAIDISRRHIQQARDGRFRDFSFRQTPNSIRDRCFQPVPGGWELNSSLRSLVQFRVGNLFDESWMAAETPYDLVFCRNLFIYLHADARRRALDILVRLLGPSGLLCVGHAEPIDAFDERFEQTGPAKFFLYRRTRLRGRETSIRDTRQMGERQEEGSTNSFHFSKPDEWINSTSILVEPTRPRRIPNPPAPIRTDRKGEVPESISMENNEIRDSATLLTQARALADQGQLVEAMTLCEGALMKAGPSADVYSLMGVIYQARQEPDLAEHCFQRALYLAPDFPEALTHLLALAESQADSAKAERFRRRIHRASKRGVT